jgi:diguanylate cyclase (GGDEF)-like protein
LNLSTEADDAQGHGDEVRYELLERLLSLTPVALAANLVNGTLVAGLFFTEHSTVLVTSWWIAILIMVAARGALWSWYQRHGGAYRRWRRIAITGSTVSGIVWGSAGLLFFSSHNETHQLVLGFILGGMAAGALTSLTACLPAFYLYLFPSTVPYGIQLAMQGDVDHLVMTVASVLYIGSLVVLGRKANRWLTESVVGRFDNAQLIRSLEDRVEKRTIELEEVNRQLRADILERTRAESALADYGRRQAAIAEFGRIALSGIDLDALFEQSVALVRDRLAVAGAAILEEPRNGKDHAECAAISVDVSSLDPTLEGTLADHPQCPLQITSSMASMPDSLLDALRHRDPSTSAEVVISNDDEPFGVLLAVDSKPRAYTVNDISFLESIANILVAAIERKRAEKEIEHLALQDMLTGLPNRTEFRNRFHQELARTKRAEQKLAVLLLDLDRFKDVNDTLGHPAGDQLLRGVAERLKFCLREEDAPARIGGDEFAVILSNLRSPEQAAAVARKILERLSQPFVLEGRQVHIGASIGITVSPDDAADVDQLLRNADLALYRAKTEGRNAHRFYASDMTVQVEARRALEHDLRRALEHDELFLEYQPEYDLRTSHPVGAEALLRWQHPTRGLLMPEVFIPVAETAGLISLLGRWVLQRVASQRRAWRDADFPPFFIAINVSLSQCRHGDLKKVIEETQTRNSDLSWLEIEVTEHLFLPPGAEDCIVTLRSLSKLGVTIAIDDFGTGYSSLGRLRDLPVDKIKIDRAFVAELGIRPSADKIVRAMITLAKSLDITVTAEGVETEEQLAFLTMEGCDCAQGNYLGLPLPPEQFATILTGGTDGILGLSQVN